MGGLAAGADGAQSPAPQANAHNNSEKANERENLEKNLASIEQVGMAVFQVGIGEDAVDEEQNGRGKNKVVEAAPERAANARSQQRREEDQQQQIQRRLHRRD